MSNEPSRFLGVTEEIGSRGEIEVFHLDTEEDSDGALLHAVDDVVEVWKRERRPLGAGGFGVAWLEKSATGKVRVVKEVKKVVNTNVMTEYWLRELSAMALLHRNTKYFPEFYGWFHDKDYVYIAMEHVNQGDLRECVTRPLPEPQSQSIAKQVAQALRILHKKGITHRDLKPANILVRQGPAPSWRVVVTDFGISKRVRDLTTSLYSSFGGDTTFMAPEILDWVNGSASDEYTNAVDMWSLGCLAYWLLKMNMPVSTSRMVSYCRSPWAEAAVSVDMAGIDETGKQFILSLINPDPNHRMDANDACVHAWLTDVSLHPAMPTPIPRKHNVKVPQEEQTRVKRDSHNLDERTTRKGDSEHSLTQSSAVRTEQKRRMSPSVLPVLDISSTPSTHPYRGTPSPDSSRDLHDPENRGESLQRESRQREMSTKHRFKKEDDAAQARKVVADDSAFVTAIETASLPVPNQREARPMQSSSPRPETRSLGSLSSQPDQRSFHTDDNQDNERYERSLRIAQDYFFTGTAQLDHLQPRPPGQESGVQKQYRYRYPDRDRKSAKDEYKQPSSSSQDPSRRSIPDESKPPLQLPTQTSAPASIRTPLGVINGAPTPVRLGQNTHTLGSHRRETPGSRRKSPGEPVSSNLKTGRYSAAVEESQLKQNESVYMSETTSPIMPLVPQRRSKLSIGGTISPSTYVEDVRAVPAGSSSFDKSPVRALQSPQDRKIARKPSGPRPFGNKSNEETRRMTRFTNEPVQSEEKYRGSSSKQPESMYTPDLDYGQLQERGTMPPPTNVDDMHTARNGPGLETSGIKSTHTANSRNTINNPKLLKTVEDAIRRLILPELKELKKDQQNQSTDLKYDNYSDFYGEASTEEKPVRRSMATSTRKHRSAQDHAESSGSRRRKISSREVDYDSLSDSDSRPSKSIPSISAEYSTMKKEHGSNSKQREATLNSNSLEPISNPQIRESRSNQRIYPQTLDLSNLDRYADDSDPYDYNPPREYWDASVSPDHHLYTKREHPRKPVNRRSPRYEAESDRDSIEDLYARHKLPEDPVSQQSLEDKAEPSSSTLGRMGKFFGVGRSAK